MDRTLSTFYTDRSLALGLLAHFAQNTLPYPARYRAQVSLQSGGVPLHSVCDNRLSLATSLTAKRPRCLSFPSPSVAYWGFKGRTARQRVECGPAPRRRPEAEGRR